MSIVQSTLSLPLEIKISISYGILTLARFVGILPADWSIVTRLILAIGLGLGLTLLAPPQSLQIEEVSQSETDISVTATHQGSELIITSSGLIMITEEDS